MNTLHIFAQAFEHSDAYVFGTEEGLLKLRAVIDAALESKTQDAYTESYCTDGEGFGIYVFLASDYQMDTIPKPYTSESSHPVTDEIKLQAMIKWIRDASKRKESDR